MYPHTLANHALVDAQFFISETEVYGQWSDICNRIIVQDLYPQWHDVDWCDTYFFCHMPAIGHYDNVYIPAEAKKIVLTCGIEPMDIEWLQKTAAERSECQICVLYNGLYAPASSFYPPNTKLLPWLTWHFQLRRMADAYGHRKEIPMPRFWASSLCNRSAQFKLYVTAYCIYKGYANRMLVSYHGIVDKTRDIDHMRTGDTLLNRLADLIEHQPALLIDNSTRQDRDLPSPKNRDWRFPQHTDCLFNFTNEGFHYSLKMAQEGDVIWPGPDLSEKTFKALLAGQALLPVGQWRSLATLRDLGFKFDYGLDFSYDEIAGDIDRILACFTTIDDVMSMPLEHLYEAAKPSCLHNTNWAMSDDFSQRCDQINQQSLTQLCQWLQI